MKNILIVFFFFLILKPLIVHSQVYENSIYEHIEYLRREKLMPDTDPKSYQNIDGSPYLKKDFEEGKIYMTNGDVFTGEYRFDLYANQIQFVKDEERYVIAYPDKIYKIELNGHTWKYIDYRIDAGIEKAYFICLAEGHYSLFLKKGKTLRNPVGAKPYQQPKPAKFLDHKDLYYIRAGENPAQRVGNRKDLLKICRNIEPDASDYIKAEKLKVNNEYDLIRFVLYLNDKLFK